MKMTRESIISIYNNINRVEGERPYNDPLRWERFRSCNAYIAHEPITVRDDETGEWHTIRVIKSYNTKVAFYDYTTQCFCEIGKFSVTTSKQCTQIYNTYYGGDRVNAMHYVAW